MAWQVMPGQTRWDQGQREIVASLMAQVAPHLAQVAGPVLADRGLASVALIRLCQAYGWHSLLRLES